MKIVKGHAYGNDFLLVRQQEVSGNLDRADLARRLCDRHRGVGADGLMIYSDGPRGASMQLLNADGSPSELSGNGVRCLAAWIARERSLRPGAAVDIESVAGVKRLEFLSMEGQRLMFRTAMGQPEQVQQETIDVDGEPVVAVTMRVGNPQCVVLGELSQERLHGIAAKLAVHPRFPEGTNVELAKVMGIDRVDILIWERGVGPTEASGTGACGAAVAAMSHGWAERDVQVVSPGGTQRVEWRADGLYLTGWAEILFDGRWIV